ncbi:MAG: hypothetical protein GX901_06630, partial [Lentisphaerae bacterium]|nr:hypothetical protein [Lentisphaerota bacterium]
ENAQTLLLRRQDGLQEGARVEFIPADYSQSYWLKVQAFDQDGAVPYTLTYEQEELSYEISASLKELYLSKNAQQFSLPLRLARLQPNEDPIEMRYRIVPLETSSLYFSVGVTAWQDYHWPETDEAELVFTLNVPEADDWEGSRDFQIELEAKDNCRIAQDSELIQGKIYAHTSFAPWPEQTELTLYAGIGFKLEIPVCMGNDYEFSSSGVLPAGLEITHDKDNNLVRISGVPSAQSDVRLIDLFLKENNVQTDRLLLQITVEDMAGQLGQAAAYAGYLLNAELTDYAPAGSLSLQRQAEGGFQLQLKSTEIAEKLQVSLAGWSGYDPLTKSLLLDYEGEGGHALHLRLSENGEGTGSFISARGQEQRVFFRAAVDNPLEYSGYYTVALRPPQGNVEDNYAYGWLQITVADSGEVDYSGELCDGSSFTGNSFVYEHEGEAEVAFFVPQDYDPAYKCHLGRLAGLLNIVPKSERDNPYDAYVSDCDDSSVWQRKDHAPIALQPCGSVYEKSLSLGEQSGSVNGLFQLQTKAPARTTAIAPNLLLLQEDQQQRKLRPNNAGIMAGLLGDMELSQDGLFTAQIRLLLPEDNIVSQALELRGVLTPVTSDCCSVGSDLFVAYGYYNYAGQTYSIRLAATPDEERRPEKPELLELAGQVQDFQYVFAANKVTATISSSGKYLLYHKEDSEQYFLQENNENQQLQL